MTLTGESQSQINELLMYALETGRKATTFINSLTKEQYAKFADHLFSGKTSRDTLRTERSLSKALSCFLLELYKEGPAHYSIIRNRVKNVYGHLVNDYSSLRYWGLVRKSNQGTGYWEVTNRGKEFLFNEIAIPATLTIKNNAVVGSSKKLVYISEFEGFEQIAYNPNDNQREPEGPIR